MKIQQNMKSSNIYKKKKHEWNVIKINLAFQWHEY